jgi:hypothetical protein
MSSSLTQRSRRWMLRRLERHERRRLKAAAPPQPRVLAAASLVDGYCELLGPAANDDAVGRSRRPQGPPLALIHG